MFVLIFFEVVGITSVALSPEPTLWSTIHPTVLTSTRLQCLKTI